MNLRWKLPLRVDPFGSYIFDRDGQMIAQIRGWGHLTGKGGGLGLDDATAITVQKQRAQAIVDAVNNMSVARKRLG